MCDDAFFQHQTISTTTKKKKRKALNQRLYSRLPSVHATARRIHNIRKKYYLSSPIYICPAKPNRSHTTTSIAPNTLESHESTIKTYISEMEKKEEKEIRKQQQKWFLSFYINQIIDADILGKIYIYIASE